MNEQQREAEATWLMTTETSMGRVSWAWRKRPARWHDHNYPRNTYEREKFVRHLIRRLKNDFRPR